MTVGWSSEVNVWRQARAYFLCRTTPLWEKQWVPAIRRPLGLSEHTDALIILVSEETGEISIANEGHFIAVHDEEHFMKLLNQILVPVKKKKHEKLV